MGKKGAALRAAKRQQATYTFTAQQLADHDNFVRQEFKARIMDDLVEKANQKMQPYIAEQQERMRQEVIAEWEERKRLFASEVPENNFLEFISCALAVSVRVLVEKFHWKPVPKDGRFDRRLAIARFSDFVKAEIDDISADEMKDIRRYSQEVYDLYGIRFAAEEEE